MDTPFQWTKQVASHWGGTRNEAIVHWPNEIQQSGGLRSQFTHVIDVAPTVQVASGRPNCQVSGLGVQRTPGIQGPSSQTAGRSFNSSGASNPHRARSRLPAMI